MPFVRSAAVTEEARGPVPLRLAVSSDYVDIHIVKLIRGTAPANPSSPTRPDSLA